MPDVDGHVLPFPHAPFGCVDRWRVRCRIRLLGAVSVPDVDVGLAIVAVLLSVAFCVLPLPLVPGFVLGARC